MLETSKIMYQIIDKVIKPIQVKKEIQIYTERELVLKSIVEQSMNIANSLGDCTQKPSLKKGDIQRKNFDLLFYNEDGSPKKKQELLDIKNQYLRNAEYCKSELNKSIPVDNSVD